MLEHFVPKCKKIVQKVVMYGVLGSNLFFSFSPDLTNQCEPRSLPIVAEKALDSFLNIIDSPQNNNLYSVDYSQFNAQELIEFIETPEQVEDYLKNYIMYDREKEEIVTDSLAFNHLDRKGKCLDYALIAAALLSDNGYEPNFFYMGSNKLEKKAHAVFVYRTSAGYRILGTEHIKPTFDSLEKVVQFYNHNYSRVNYHFYGLFQVEDIYQETDWIYGSSDLTYVPDNFQLSFLKEEDL